MAQGDIRWSSGAGECVPGRMDRRRLRQRADACRGTCRWDMGRDAGVLQFWAQTSQKHFPGNRVLKPTQTCGVASRDWRVLLVHWRAVLVTRDCRLVRVDPMKGHLLSCRRRKNER